MVRPDGTPAALLLALLAAAAVAIQPAAESHALHKLVEDVNARSDRSWTAVHPAAARASRVRS
jgi:hypothetical protein